MFRYALRAPLHKSPSTQALAAQNQMPELDEILIEIQDLLVPVLDSYEQAIYHYIFRHTYLCGKKQVHFSTRTAQIGFGTGDNAKQPSWKTRSKKLRTLEQKGAVKIIERSRQGILVELRLPHDISGLQVTEELQPINIEELDFYKDKRLLVTLLEREQFRCFYTDRTISENNTYLDHVVPQSGGGDNSYRNIVTSCFDANSMKNHMPASEFIRKLYREEIISMSEFSELKSKIERLQAGELKPNIEAVRSALGS